MGNTMAYILRHIGALPPEQIFTTRDMLHYGRRNQVDYAMFTLVNTGFLRRLARGVFIRTEFEREVSFVEIATIKAESFGRRIAKYCVNAANELGVSNEQDSDPTFEIDAHSSSFMFSGIRIRFKGTSPRKFVDKDEKHNLITRALWHVGKTTSNLDTSIARLWSKLNRVEKLNLKIYARWMPSWLSDRLSHGFYARRTRRRQRSGGPQPLQSDSPDAPGRIPQRE